jgi:hypothetical protein
MAKVYVAGFDRWAARYVADELTKGGHKVVSSWHDAQDRPATDEGWTAVIGGTNAVQILACDVLVLIACKGEVPGGKHVEAGIAIGAGKRVVVLGKRENRLYWHPSVTEAADISQLLAAIAN